MAALPEDVRPPIRDHNRTVLVVGAGIVGVAIAFELQSRGRQVTLIDRHEPGRGASFGNMGSIAVSEFAPLARPDVWRQVPGWLLDSSGPIRLRPLHTLKAAPWFWRFLQSSRPSCVQKLKIAGAQLCGGALEDWIDLLQKVGGSSLLSKEGCLAVYSDRHEYERDKPHRDLFSRFGIPHEWLDAGQLRELEPELSPDLHGAILLPANRTISDPYRLVQTLFDAFLKRGGLFKRAEIDGLSPDDQGVAASDRRAGLSYRASDLVIAAGAYSGRLSKLIGDHLPMETERGYHTQIMTPGIVLRHSLISPAKAFMVAPLAGGVRVGGTVEFGGLDAPPDFRRSLATTRHAVRMLPRLQVKDASQWMGHRPALPDTIPVISRSPTLSNFYYATGHGHLGLTLAATTAKLMADLMSGAASRIDLRPFQVDRFKISAGDH